MIHSTISFWISAFRLPKECIKEIDKLCYAFLWSGSELNTKKAKIAWSEVCKPEEEGGLGLRSLAESNKVSCLKLVWRLLSSKTSLWVQWIHLYLMRKGSFWSIKEKTSLGSWMWKKLLKYRNLASTFTRVQIQDGQSTSFWYDTWSPLGRLIDLTGIRGYIDMGISINATVETAVNTRRRRKHRVEVLNSIEKEIQKIRDMDLIHGDYIRLRRGTNDIFKPKFSTRSMWKLTRIEQPRVEWNEGIWFHHATPKYSFITWLSVHDRLSTGDKILQWNIQANTSCTFCNASTETHNHLYFQCKYTEDVWKELSYNILGSKYTAQWSNILELLVDLTMGKIKLFLLRYVFQTTVYSLWRERNGRKHGEPPLPHTQLVRNIDKLVRNRISSIRQMGDTRYSETMEMWFALRDPV